MKPLFNFALLIALVATPFVARAQYAPSTRPARFRATSNEYLRASDPT